MVETRGGRRFAVFFLAAAFLVLILGRWLTPVNHMALSAAAPFAAVVSAAASEVGNGVSGIVDGPGLREQNQQLQLKIGTLLRSNAILQEQAHENQILTSMLRYDDANNHMDFLTARVITTGPNGPDSLDPYIIINRGTRDGLHNGMTVLNQDGYFVGTIVDIMSNAAKVLLMISPSSSVGAIDLKTRAVGLVEGKFAARPVFDFVVTSATIHVGDFIVTSGQDNLYPRTLLLGQVVRVRHSNVSVFQTAEIAPAANFQDLEMVQVVRNFVPSVPSKLLTSR